MQTIIRPKKWSLVDIKELWRFRELYIVLAWRDIKVRYKQTSIGILWAIIQPFLLMVVFSVFFGRIAGISSEGIPYPLFAYSGLLFWNYFSNSLTDVSGSMVANQALLQKIYFPRLIIPLSSSVVYLIDFAFSSLVFAGLCIYYGIFPSLLGLALVIPALLITMLSFTGLGLFFSAVNVKYRDVRYALPFFIQLLIFVTPVIYPPSVLGDYRWLWFLNPMSGVIDTMRAAMFGLKDINWLLLLSSFGMAILFFIIGFLYFKRTERFFADLV